MMDPPPATPSPLDLILVLVSPARRVIHRGKKTLIAIDFRLVQADTRNSAFIQKINILMFTEKRALIYPFEWYNPINDRT